METLVGESDWRLLLLRMDSVLRAFELPLQKWTLLLVLPCEDMQRLRDFRGTSMEAVRVREISNVMD